MCKCRKYYNDDEKEKSLLRIFLEKLLEELAKELVKLISEWFKKRRDDNVERTTTTPIGGQVQFSKNTW